MNKKITFLLTLTFLFLFCGSSVVFAGDYEDGMAAGRKGDCKTLVEKLRLSAEQSHPKAQFTLGVLHGGGKCVKKDRKESMRWYHKAAEQGHVEAQNLLGINYFEGFAVPKNYKEAYKWSHKAAEQGHKDAQFQLCLLYFQGLGVSNDFKEAATWCLRAAKQGNKEAQTMLGSMYSQGQGVVKDDDEAAKWNLLAAKQGVPHAQASACLMYSSGLGVKKDFLKAIKWCRLAAKQGNSMAQSTLDKLMNETDEQPKLNEKSYILLECKTKKKKVVETDIIKFDPTIKKIIWVEDDKGLLINFEMEIEKFSDGVIRASYTMKQLFTVAESVQQDLSQKQLAELQDMKAIINYFQKNLPEELVKQGVPPSESKKMAQRFFDGAFGFKHYLEINRISGEIQWIKPYQKAVIPGGKDIKREVKKGKCVKLKRKF